MYHVLTPKQKSPIHRPVSSQNFVAAPQLRGKFHFGRNPAVSRSSSPAPRGRAAPYPFLSRSRPGPVPPRCRQGPPAAGSGAAAAGTSRGRWPGQAPPGASRGSIPGTLGKAGHPRGAGQGKAPPETGEPPRTCSTRLGKCLMNHQDCIVVIPLSDRNSFLSIHSPLHAPTRDDTVPCRKTAPERPEHTDRMWRMKRGKPPIKPSRTFPGTWSRAARGCRHPNCPSERLSTSSDCSLRAVSSSFLCNPSKILCPAL